MGRRLEVFDSNMRKEIKNLMGTSRKVLRNIINTHLNDVTHDDVRKNLELNFFYKALNVITKKWSVQLLWELEVHGPMIFNVLMRHLDGISSRSLSDTLKNLEKYKLVLRSVQDTRPPSVLYQLTDKGKGLVELSILLIIQLIDL